MKRLMMMLVVLVVLQNVLEGQTTMPQPRGFSVGRSSRNSSPVTNSSNDLTIFSNVAKTEMIYVDGGSFSMGCTEEQSVSDCENDKRPIHTVSLSSFYIGKYEVTQALWLKVMGNNPSKFSACGNDCPVEKVSWDDCQEFIKKLNQMTGKVYRLPTEAEWEFAARGGKKSKGYRYSGSNDQQSVAWHFDNSDRKTHEVGLKQANELGIYDMTGNVWEWCSDGYSSDYYSKSSQNNPTGPTTGVDRIRRGGSWLSDHKDCPVSNRNDSDPVNKVNNLGFRLVLVP